MWDKQNASLRSSFIAAGSKKKAKVEVYNGSSAHSSSHGSWLSRSRMDLVLFNLCGSHSASSLAYKACANTPLRVCTNPGAQNKKDNKTEQKAKENQHTIIAPE